ncbi:MAG: hypothetical protein ACE37F_19380 [Nannocystaceae bacterium]|nr:hypothetical protein [bacterium]
MVRTILKLAALTFVVGCPVPSTLGLPCTRNSHCDPGQVCVDDVCEEGMPGETTMTPPMTMPPQMTASMSGTSDATDSVSTTDDSATVTGEGSTSGSTTDDSAGSSSSSTGQACGVDTCSDLDILLLVDSSDSMSQWLLPLGNSLPDLFALFEAELGGVCSFHIGIANHEEMPEANPPQCQIPGALLQRPESCNDRGLTTPYYSEEDGTPAEAFAALQCAFITAGFGGSDDERMLDSMLGALDPDNNAEGGCNEGFRRPGASLVIVYLSDEDDPTPMDEQDTVAELFATYVDPNLVAFISVVADPANEEPECQWDPFAGDEGEGAEISSALNGFLALSGIPLDQQARVDICQTVSYEFDDAFAVFSTVCE